jgi:hypothetical protein
MIPVTIMASQISGSKNDPPKNPESKLLANFAPKNTKILV